MANRQVAVHATEKGFDVEDGHDATHQADIEEDVLPGSPSKQRRPRRAIRYGHGSQVIDYDTDQKRKKRCRTYCCCTLSVLAVILLVLGLLVVTNQIQIGFINGMERASLMNQTECVDKWETVLFNSELQEQPCTAYSGIKDTCSKTTNCCWSAEGCMTADKLQDCHLESDKIACELHEFCAWRPELNACRRANRAQEDAILKQYDDCSKHWKVDMLQPSAKCYDFLSAGLCATQIGCCWGLQNQTKCTLAFGTVDCAERGSKFDCEQALPERLPSCVWSDNNEECYTGLIPPSSPSPPSFTRFPTSSLSTPMPPTKSPLLTTRPTATRTSSPTLTPSNRTSSPSSKSTIAPSKQTQAPSYRETVTPTTHPTTRAPSQRATLAPSRLLTTQQPTNVASLTSSPSIKTASPTRLPTESPTKNRPNKPSVLIFLADDLGYGDVGYLGGLGLTPNIDSLANSASALRLDNFHSGSSVCSPSRASLLSGLNPERVCMPGIISESKDYDLPANMPTIAQFFRNNGYRTGFLGKWHLGSPPVKLGFDYWAYSNASVPTFDPACFCDEKRCIDSCRSPGAECQPRVNSLRCTSKLTLQCQAGHRGHGTNFGYINWGCDLQEGETTTSTSSGLVQFPRNVTAAEHMAALTVEYLDTVPRNLPFFVQLSFHEPHLPFFASDYARRDCLAGRTCRLPNIQRFDVNSIVVNFYAVINSMDTAVGVVMTKLRSLGRVQDTIVIFASDNGYESPEVGGIPRIVETRYLRDYKRSVYEGGTRVPAFLSWPRMISSNFVISEPTSMLDIFPTLVDVIEAPSQSSTELMASLGGESWVPLINNPLAWNRTRPFGVCMPITFAQSGLCSTFSYFEGHRKVVATVGELNRAEVFNVLSDRSESTNLAKTSLPNGLLERARIWRDAVIAENKRACKPTTGTNILDDSWVTAEDEYETD